MSGVWIAVVVCLWVVVVTLAVVVAGLLRRVAVVLEAQPVAGEPSGVRSGPVIGDRLPSLFVGEPGGRAVALSEVPGPFVLAVLTSTCSPCLVVADWLRDHREQVVRSGRRLVVLTNAGGRERLALEDVLTVMTDDRGDVIAALQLRGTPYVIEVDADGAVARSSVLGGPDRLASILEADHAGHDELIRVELVS